MQHGSMPPNGTGGLHKKRAPAVHLAAVAADTPPTGTYHNRSLNPAALPERSSPCTRR